MKPMNPSVISSPKYFAVLSFVFFEKLAGKAKGYLRKFQTPVIRKICFEE